VSSDDFALKVWRLHPNGCRLEAAEKTLHGDAHPGGVQWCGPFTNANRSGWWLFPPVDVDITWLGGREFETDVLTPYTDDDAHLIRFLLDDADEAHPDAWLDHNGRTKFTWGLLEDGVVQIWTGCVFETPPGWGLHIRSPINMEPPGFRVMEAILETDWLQYDIWLNLVFERPNERISLRRDGWPPVAQLVPVRRESYDAPWAASEELLNRNSPDANRVFEFFVQYNEKKFAHGGRQRLSVEDPERTKDSTTYYRERKRMIDAATPSKRPPTPNPDA
jgi:hypothetical protein